MSKNDVDASQDHIKKAVITGAAVAGAVGLGSLLLGSLAGAEAARLVEAMVPTSRLLSSTVMTVTATILALMLTLLGFSNNLDAELSDVYYRRINLIAMADAITFGAAALLFLFHCVPIYESESIPFWWYPAVYYVTLAGAALTTGAVVGIVTLLLLAIRELVGLLNSDQEDHRLLRSPPE